MKIICPVDPEHKTTDPLYCSTCGAKIVPIATKKSAPENTAEEVKAEEELANPVEHSVSTFPESPKNSEPKEAAPTADDNAQVRVCPDCSTERTNLKVAYCEVCRYNFEAKAYSRFKTTIDLRTKGSAPRVPVDPVIAMTIKENVVGNKNTSSESDSEWQPNKRWEILVVVDSSLYQPPDPQSTAPDEPDRVFHLDTTECLVGRKSESRKIYPEVCLNDPGVSHRHFKLLKDKEEHVHILDVGSANGTTLNDENLPAGVKKLLRHGDQITVGCWTRITVQLATIE